MFTFFLPWTLELLALGPSDSETNSVASCFSGLRLNYTTAFLALQLAEDRLWDFLTSIGMTANSYNKYPLVYICIYSIGSVSVENSNTDFDIESRVFALGRLSYYNKIL